MSYALGAVKPWVQDVADKLGPLLKPDAIYGWRATSVDMSGHPAGLALDWAIGNDTAKGQNIADYFTANAAGLQVKYVIWQQRIWYPGKPWTLMATRVGTDDVNHLHHVHVSFNPVVADGRRLGGGAAPAPAAAGGNDGGTSVLGQLGNAASDVVSSLNPLSGVDQIAHTLTDRMTWIRVAQVVLGVAAIIGGIVIMNKDLIGSVAGAAAFPEGAALKSLGGAALGTALK